MWNPEQCRVTPSFVTALHPGLVCHAIHAILKFHVLSGSIRAPLFLVTLSSSIFCNLFIDKHISRTRDVNTTAQLCIVVRDDVQLENLKSETVVSLKYEGVPSRAGKPSGWEARREKLTMEKSHIKLTWAATMALGGATSCFIDTLSWSDCPFHLWSLLALSSGVKIAETRKNWCARGPLFEST